MLVERERARPRPNTVEKLQFAAEAGQQLLRMLARESFGTLYHAAIIAKFPLPKPSPEEVSLAGPRDAFIRWYDQLFNEPPSGVHEDRAWSPSRMEYAFAIGAVAPGASFTPADTAARGETVLVAREYSNGHLNWLDFDIRPGAALGGAADRSAGSNPLPIEQTVIPAPVTFRGMPAPRWWEFEDAAVDFGAVEPDPQDLARMLMLEFAIS